KIGTAAIDADTPRLLPKREYVWCQAEAVSNIPDLRVRRLPMVGSEDPFRQGWLPVHELDSGVLAEHVAEQNPGCTLRSVTSHRTREPSRFSSGMELDAGAVCPQLVFPEPL